MITETRLPLAASIATIALLFAISIGCTFDGPPPGSAAKAWAGCYRGGNPETGLLLEQVIDEGGAETAMLTGCLRIGIGLPNSPRATLAGVAQSATTLEMSDGEENFLLTKDFGSPEVDGDATITIASDGQMVGPIPLCTPEQLRTCEEILGGAP